MERAKSISKVIFISFATIPSLALGLVIFLGLSEHLPVLTYTVLLPSVGIVLMLSGLFSYLAYLGFLSGGRFLNLIFWLYIAWLLVNIPLGTIAGMYLLHVRDSLRQCDR